MTVLCPACAFLGTHDGLERLYSSTGFQIHGSLSNVLHNGSLGCVLCSMLTNPLYSIKSDGCQSQSEWMLADGKQETLEGKFGCLASYAEPS